MNFRTRRWRCLWILGSLLAFSGFSRATQKSGTTEDVLVTSGEVGQRGGRLVASLRSDPKSFNPVTAIDAPSKQVLSLLFADLIHINPYTQHTQAALAKSWTASSDGRRYTLELRRDIRFSDGHPFDADDVVFSFRVYQDENV